MTKFAAGQTWKKPTPFLIEDRVLHDAFGERTVKSWRPGIRWVPVAPDDSDPDWDDDGYEVRTISAYVEIKGETSRILYRRHWIGPDGKEFGKRTMQMTTPSAFSAWINDTAGYRDRDSRMVAEMAA